MNIRPLAAEFIGTFALIFVGVGAIAADVTSGGKLGLTGIALAHGLTIAVMVSATAATSGGHLNPAVTFGALIAGAIGPKDAVLYLLAQCLGAIAAAATIQQVVFADVLSTIQWGTPALGLNVTGTQGLVAETVLTFFLVFTVFGTAVDQRAARMGGLFIGLAVAIGVMVGGPISGGAMNPARHLGPALLGGTGAEAWLYWIGPLLGGGIAGAVSRTLFRLK